MHDLLIIERLMVLIWGSSVLRSVMVTLKASRSSSPYYSDSYSWNFSSVEQRGLARGLVLRNVDDRRLGLFYFKARFIGCYSLYIIESSFKVYPDFIARAAR